MDDIEEIRAWLVLLRAPGVGAAGLRALLGRAGSATALLERREWLRERSGREETRRWLEQPDMARIDTDLAWLAEPGHRLLRCTDADFPPQLEQVDHPPAALFVDGDAGALLRAQVAVVGARGASPQGLEDARRFAGHLAASGLVVTSGLADGIDGAAHAAALDAGGSTIAVLGTGVDVAYPRKHASLAARVAAGGALVSEFPLGTGARAEHFPQRNRIISGLALGTLVVEAGLRSGSLITARLAAEQGREVHVLPGSIHSPLKHGCHRLIRDGARLVEHPGEVIESLAPAARALGAELAARLDTTLEKGQDSPDTRTDDPEYRALFAALGNDAASLDQLAARSGLGAAALSSMLLLLELEGEVASLPGGRFQRLMKSAPPP